MKILFVHNYYQKKGGEESVFDAEISLLKKSGVEVVTYVENNTQINGFFQRVRAFFGSIYSFNTARKIRKILKEEKPDVVHVHNFFPIISPSVFYAAKSMKTKVVFTLHNFRIICPTATFLFEGEINTKSLNSCWWALMKKVYKNSYVGTLALCFMISFHRKIGTWNKVIDKFIALNEFSKDVFVDWGIASAKIAVKPNFIELPMNCRTDEQRKMKKSDFALFVGRISEEKGIDILLEAWTGVDMPLHIVGDGPQRVHFENKNYKNVHWKGFLNKDEIIDEMERAHFVVVPSIWYENFPMVIVESFSCGTPVIATKIGGLATIIKDGVNGLHFKLKDPIDLREKILWMFNNEKETKALGKNASLDFENYYSANENLRMLLEIYRNA